MSEKLRVGVVGLGQRGTGLLNDLLLNMPNIEISAVCDVYSDRVDFASGLVRGSWRQNSVLHDGLQRNRFTAQSRLYSY